MFYLRRLLLASVVIGLAAFGEMSRLPQDASIGPRPTLPPPVRAVMPTVDRDVGRTVWRVAGATSANGR